MLATHCPSCGAAVPVSLATPHEIACGYCRYRGKPHPDAERRMLEAIEVLRASDARNRQVAGLRRWLVGSGKWVSGCTLTFALLLTVTVGLPISFVLLLIAPGIISGWREKVSWVIAISPLPLGVFVGGVTAALLVWRAVRRLELACAAVPPERPGDPAACHACGAPLMRIGEQAIVRCGYCQTDNVATRRALDLARRRRDVVLDDYSRQIRQVSLRVPAFSLLGGIGWFLLVTVTVFGSCAGAQIYDAKLARETGPQGAAPLVKGQNVVAVAQSGNEIFFQSGVALGAVAKTGGAPREIARFNPSSATTKSLVVDATHVYWVTTKSAVVSVPKSGGAVREIGRVQGATVANLRLTADDTDLFCTTPSGVVKVPKAGGSATVLADGRFPPGDIAVHGDTVFWFEKAPVGAESLLRSVPKSGGEPKILLRSEALKTDVPPVSDGAFVYYVSNYGYSINRVPVAGGTWTRLTTDPATHIELLALDGDELYFATQYDSLGCSGSTYGKLHRMRKAGGGVVTLTSGFKTPSGMALDGERVYVGDLFRETIVGIAKTARQPSD